MICNKKIKKGLFALMAAGFFISGIPVNASAKGLPERTVPYQYSIASVSKVFVSVAVMQLYEQGKLDLDTPIEQYIPEFCMADERYHKITPRMLLDHTSGLMGTHYINSTHFGEISDYPKEMLLENLKYQTLKTEPGTYASYCNDGFTLAEILVERVSGMEFSEYLEKNICTPLQMENTTTSFGQKTIQVPIAYNRYLDNFQFPEELEGETGSGGIHSTTEDMCRLTTVFMGEKPEILSGEMTQLMMQNQYEKTEYYRAEGDSNEKYGLGFDGTQDYVFDRYGIKAVSKGGDTYFQHANLTILPEEKIACAVTCSGGNSTYAQMMSQELLLTVLEEKGKIKRYDAEGSVRELSEQYEQLKKKEIPASLNSYEGIYAAEDCMLELSFPSKDTMQLRRLDEEGVDVQTYTYRENGWFTGRMGSYLFSGMNTARDGMTGISKVKLCTEQDGSRYLLSNSYMEISGFPTQAMSLVAAVKVEEQSAEKGAIEAWNQRVGKQYFLVNAMPSSEDYDIGNKAVLEWKESGAEGFLRLSSGLVMEIVDENQLKTAKLGRDMTQVIASKKGDTEYLQFTDYGYICAGEEILEDFPSNDTTITMDRQEETKWYRIPREFAGKRVKVQVDEGAEVFFYDCYHNLVYSTHMLNAGEMLSLPKEGYMAFAAPKGKKCQVTYLHEQ